MNLSKEILATFPFVIAGPCSAESEEQIHETVTQLAKLPEVKLIRAGIWKPRTRPNSFEGLGEKALPWLVEAGKRNNLPTCIEVANTKHVELSLAAGVDVLWIGARTTVNPFAVQEIVEALKGTQIPIMIKNPVNPDLNLWIGAFERFQNAGLHDLCAIHRGFSIYQHPKYRNVPNWDIPIAFKQQMPDIPMICDPSHITGNRTLLLDVAQKALDLNFHGLMLESHIDPENALSDKEQQVTPSVLKNILNSLVLRRKNIDSSLYGDLESFRLKIKNLDESLFEIIAERMKISEEVGTFKKDNNITILQEEHWKAVFEHFISKAQSLNLSSIFIKSIMEDIHQESIRHQVKVMKSKTND